MQTQTSLELVGGHHIGPLWAQRHVRAPKVGIRSSARFRFLRRRTPAWADRDLLRCLKRLSSIYTKALGEQFSEDHIVPLNHPLVCGLHTPDNIELKPLRVNLMKSNTFWPDMPEAQTELFQ